MKRLFSALAGFAVLYAVLAALNWTAHVAGCNGNPFCIIPANVPHPWMPFLAASDVAEFANTFLFFAFWTPVGALAVCAFLSNLEARRVLVVLTGIAAAAAVYTGLASAALGSPVYGPHPVMFWQQNQDVLNFAGAAVVALAGLGIGFLAVVLARQAVLGIKVLLNPPHQH